jgi:ABC-type polysaccharide/polyol phosphate export permease
MLRGVRDKNSSCSPMGEPFSARRLADLLCVLSLADLRARYGRGPWQLVKWLIDPFALVGVYLVLMTFVLTNRGPAPGLSLACAVVPFQLLMLAVINAMDAIRSRGQLLANMSFPRVLLPIASALTEAVGFGTSLLLLGLMMVIYGVAPTLAAVWLPLVLLTTFIFATAVAYPAALIGLWVPDMRAFVVSLVRTMFFLAPGLVALNRIQGTTGDIVRINPLTGLFEAYRDVLMRGRSPRAWELLWPLAVALVLVLVFVPVYGREQGQIAKMLD